MIVVVLVGGMLAGLAISRGPRIVEQPLSRLVVALSAGHELQLGQLNPLALYPMVGCWSTQQVNGGAARHSCFGARLTNLT